MATFVDKPVEPVQPHQILRPRLSVSIDEQGHPYVRVPDVWMWDLVEYLSFHRLNLSYHFEHTHFRVVFRCQSAEKAQRLVDDWASGPSDEEPN
jgi:hypothetical protein